MARFLADSKKKKMALVQPEGCDEMRVCTLESTELDSSNAKPTAEYA